MSGTLDVLACHAGHTTIQFDKNNAIEMDRTRRLIKQMIRMGCIIFIEVDNKQIRVYDFDESCDCYIVADVPELKGLGDAVIDERSIGVQRAPSANTGPQSNAASQGTANPNADDPRGGESADSAEGGTSEPELAAAPSGEDVGVPGRKKRGRPKKVDASKVKATAVPIQSGG